MSRLVNRHFALLVCAVLALTAFNLFFRLGQEFVRDWDESLYAITAAELLQKGNWIGTTFLGQLDYYNTKPPLNVWLIALAFKAFGTNLVSLRAVSAVSAWLTVAVLIVWTRRYFGSLVALASGLVLSTCFAFFYVHSGRNGNTDPLFTLLVLLTVVVMKAEESQAWHRVWLGPLLAAVFLLRGMGVLMPLAIVAIVFAWRGRKSLTSWVPTLAAVALFVVPVAAWAVARYSIDGWEFIGRLFWYDFVARTTSVIEEHPGGALFYLNVLQKYQFDWLAFGLAALLLFPVSRSLLRERMRQLKSKGLTVVLVAWGAVTLLMPTLMQTKLPWYLDTFYPLFAIGIGVILAHAASRANVTPQGLRRFALAGVFLLVVGVAETRLIWYSFHYRDLRLSDQSLMLAEQSRLQGTRVFRASRGTAGFFVARDVIGAEPLDAPDLYSFLRDSRPGDFLLTTDDLSHPDLELINANGYCRLYRRASVVQASAAPKTDAPRE